MNRTFFFIIIFFYCLCNTSVAQRINSFTILDSANAGLVSYPVLGNYFSYSKTGQDGFYDIYTMNLDGTNKYCWTCSSSLLRNNAHPEWHPGMGYIIFEGEKNNNTFQSDPGFGWNYDLWALKISDGSLYKIRDPYSANPGYSLTGVLHPHFSHDGTKLAWSELRGSLTNWQNYAIMIADFIATPTPHLTNVSVLYDPIYGLAETQGFSFNDDKLLFAGNIDSAQSPATLDLYYLQLGAGYTLQNPDPVPVSKSVTEWAEAAKFIPSDQKIIFSTTKTFPVYPDSTPSFTWRKSEYWIVNTDGSNPQRLSYFMEPDSTGFISEQSDAADFDISPDGNELIATIHANDKLYVAKIGLDLLTTGVPENKKEKIFKVQPDPAKEYLVISSENSNKDQILIFNIMGAIVKEEEITRTSIINISGLSNGLYFIRFKEHPQHIEKFIKQ